MSKKFKLTEVDVSGSFPAKWEGTFTGKPTAEEIETEKSIVQEEMTADKNRQVKEGKASEGFKLVFDWAKKKEDPLTYALTVDLVRQEGFGKGQGQEVAPKPTTPPPPK